MKRWQIKNGCYACWQGSRWATSSKPNAGESVYRPSRGRHRHGVVSRRSVGLVLVAEQGTQLVGIKKGLEESRDLSLEDTLSKPTGKKREWGRCYPSQHLKLTNL